ncbi:MAG: hypothetical protein IKP50_04450 [Bacilli bacterium]|nr:hypothetical protein [Bacilli bacterium]
MNKEKKLSLRLGLLAGIITIGLLGSTAGTLAWYAYSRNVTMSYIGTTVSSSALMNIGLVDNGGVFTTEKLTEYNLEREDATDGSTTNSIVWAKSRSGFSVEAIYFYLESTSYAVNYLKPVTTGSRAYDDDSELKLYRAPEYSEVAFDTEAETDHYVRLPLAFRIMDETSQYVANKKIWLTDSVVEAENDAESTVRLFVDGANKFLMQPSDERNAVGETKVGGLLSLSPNDYYDYDSFGKEYCYGEFENEVQYSSLPASDYDVLDNVNDVEDTSEPTTFYGKHYPGVQVPDIDAAVPKVQEHAGLGKVKPSVRPNGELYHDETNGNGIYVAQTSTESKVGYTTVTIFVEGWDHSMIDQKAGYRFNLGLKFEIDRI